MKKRKGLAVLLLTVMVLLLLGGCLKKFDAAGYTKAVLDVSYKNETKQYMELTKSSKEQAEKVFSDNLNNLMMQLIVTNISEETRNNFRAFFEELIKNVKYTVGEATEDKKGNFAVDVTVEPILTFDNTFDEFMKQSEAYGNQVSQDSLNGGTMPSQADIQSHVFDIYYDILRKDLDQGVEYGDAQVITIHVNKNKNNVYEIPKEDLVALDQLTISMEALQ